MATPKAVGYLQELDLARCKGEWGKVPELARKVQKHAPGRSCLCTVARAEAKLHLSYLPAPASTSPHFAGFASALEQLEGPIKEELANANQLSPKLPTPADKASAFITVEDIFQAKVTAGWLAYLKQDYDNALSTLPTEQEALKLNPSDGEMEYTRVLVLKCFVLKGLVLEVLRADDGSVPLSVYKQAIRLPHSSALGQYEEGILWGEKALGRYAVVAYDCWEKEEAKLRAEGRTSQTLEHLSENAETDGTQRSNRSSVVAVSGFVDDVTVMFAFRRFNNFLQEVRKRAVSSNREVERREVYRSYLRFLACFLKDTSEEYQNQLELQLRQRQQIPTQLGGAQQNESHTSLGIASAVASTVAIVGADATGLPVSREELKQEVKFVEKIYGDYLFTGLGFPSADEVHEEVLEFVDLVMQNWRSMGSTGEDAKDVVEVLYRSSTKTYHSPRILRHLFLTLSSTGNFHDAALAIDTYMEIVLKARSRIAKGSHELDMDDYSTIITAVSEAIKILVRYVGDGKKALELSDHIEDWLAEWRLVVQDELEDEETETVTEPETLAVAWRAVGIANACWARQTVETADRTECQEKAISAFRKGISYDPQDVDALYDLAIVLAETRDIEAAIDTVKQALGSLEQPITLDSDGPPVEMNEVHREYLRKSIPILHLLALLLSSSQEFDTAERMCEAAFDLFGGEMAILQTDKSTMNFDNFRDHRWNLVNGLSLGEKERLLELKMTQIALVEAQEDADSAVNMADELLTMYRSLFGNLAANEITAQVKLEEPAPVVRPSTKRSMFAGRRSKRDSLSSVAPGSSANDLSQASTLKPDGASRGVSQQASREAINAPNPTIAVTDPNGANQEDKSAATKSRRSRVGSLTGSIRRKKSVGSVKSVKRAIGGSLSEVPSTPPPPIPRTGPPAAEKSPGMDSGSTTPAHPHRQKLKDLVHHHHHDKREGSGTSNADARPVNSSEPGLAITTEGDGITHSFPQDEMPHPVRGLGAHHDETKRSIKRPPSLPEPSLTEEDVKKRVSGILLRVWLLIAGLYRRAHQLEEATNAIKEAWTLVGADEEREADVWVEEGLLFIARSLPTQATNAFDTAIALQPDHTYAIVGLCNILLNIYVPPTATSTANPAAETSTGITNAQNIGSRTIVTEPELTALAKRDRAYGLLNTLTKLKNGWDCSEAWFALATAYEKGSQFDKARECLWWCVRLEDTRPVRGWSRVGVYVL
ncbi:hypothetical protein BJ508DRAFT_413967 [Ascobolus immersus RN42]|uniref:TPR-like protein n=1 Tax=Ascobolus immersus RN42 TaxID=1160509 RepID=A0A3N4I9N7_ASCIM|nr:hypothetical protein BJ508DRAFT_413967 [Ascobolus immersus RN42]